MRHTKSVKNVEQTVYVLTKIDSTHMNSFILKYVSLRRKRLTPEWTFAENYPILTLYIPRLINRFVRAFTMLSLSETVVDRVRSSLLKFYSKRI